MTEVDIRELRTCDWDRTHTQNDLERCMVFPELTGVREGCLDARLTEGTPQVEPEGGSGLRCGRRKRQNAGGDTGRPPGSPRATDHVPEMQKLIAQLIERGNAYAAGGDVYFAVRSYPPYGKLSKRNLDDLLSGARVEPGERKRDPLDFALWKAAKPGEPASVTWESPWGPGRPGWHIECSAMSQKYLGTSFDVHGGGKDLVFPHHENEIAQSEAASGQPLARFWLHNGFVTIDAEKMSKSLGNFRTIRDLLQHWDGESLRAFLLSTHYRHPINFTESAPTGGSSTSTSRWRRAPRTCARRSSAASRSRSRNRWRSSGPRWRTTSTAPTRSRG